MENSYIEYVKHVNDSYRYSKKPKRIENYPIYITRWHDGHTYFRFGYNLIRWKLEDNMTLKTLEKRLVKDFPFIKSVRFYDETPYGCGILVM